jgi:hypothetical protein
MVHFLLCTILQFPPRWRNNKNCNKCNGKNNYLLHIKCRLPNDDSTKWLYRRRIEEQLESTTEGTTIENSWCSIQNKISTAANESLGTVKSKCRWKYL